MRRFKWFLVLSMVGLMLPAAARPQVCGDVNGSGYVSITDMSMVMAYLVGVPVDLPAQADCDNRLGVTVSDVEVMCQFLFQGAPSTILDCDIQSTYGFAPSLTDTVFFPYMTGIPDGINSVSLPLVTSLADDTRAFYFPADAEETNGPDLFQVVHTEREGPAVDFTTAGMDNIIGYAVELGFEADPEDNILGGRHTFYSVIFDRVQPGEAAIYLSNMVGSSVSRLSLKKGDDLYTPVVVLVEVPVPHPIITAAPSPLIMQATGGYWSSGTYDVTFVSDGIPTSFNVAASDPWIEIQNPSETGYTTPATITVRANASALTAGGYSGQLTISDINPADAEFIPPSVEVTLTVTEPIVFPPGDLNCDGQVTIGDVALLIDCLFINTRPLEPCTQP